MLLQTVLKCYEAKIKGVNEVISGKHDLGLRAGKVFPCRSNEPDNEPDNGKNALGVCSRIRTCIGPKAGEY